MTRTAAVPTLLVVLFLAGCGVTTESEPVPLTESAVPLAPTPLVTQRTLSVPPPLPPPAVAPQPTPAPAPSLTRNAPPSAPNTSG
jgi:hypothetical protein